MRISQIRSQESSVEVLPSAFTQGFACENWASSLNDARAVGQPAVAQQPVLSRTIQSFRPCNCLCSHLQHLFHTSCIATGAEQGELSLLAPLTPRHSSPATAKAGRSLHAVLSCSRWGANRMRSSSSSPGKQQLCVMEQARRKPSNSAD